jgi:penicillin-binding protein 1A
MTKLRKYIKPLLTLAFLGGAALLITLLYFNSSLPSYKQLKNYNPPTISRFYAANGDLLEEYAKERRLFTPIAKMPKNVINAFISAEDSNFYNHSGVDLKSFFRAMWQNIFLVSHGKSMVGGSTITQQIVKNTILSNERTISRKIKEAILAIKISKYLSKEEVLELYLNEIYLGNRSYGVTAAALNYFNKSINELTIAEAAFLAALPKAPASLNPNRNYDRAIERRNWVISRLVSEGYITPEEAEIEKAAPILLQSKNEKNLTDAQSFAETVRQQIEELYGKDMIYEEGIAVSTTLSSTLQEYAVAALQKGIRNYDMRHGYRGAIGFIEIVTAEQIIGQESPDTEIIETSNWAEKLADINKPTNISNWDLAVILELNDEFAQIGFEDNVLGQILLTDLTWAKKALNITDPETNITTESLGPKITKPSDVLQIGDVVIVEKVPNTLANNYRLRQVPAVNGALIALNPHSGSVVAMVGGYNDTIGFNRATQAKRQPGSVMKPFTYLAALEAGIPSTTIIIDDEVRMKKEDGTYWIPQNYSNKYYGPTTMRTGLEKSRNVATVRLAEMAGIYKVAEIVKRFGIDPKPTINYSMVLGAAETTLLDITNAYAMLANGGKKITPQFIEKIQDKHGKIIYRMDNRPCENCQIDMTVEQTGLETETQQPKPNGIILPQIADVRETMTDERSAYQMVSLLEGVVQRGTGWRAKYIGKPLGGKTGTTNDSFDAWFIGFSPDLVVGVWVGFDQPKTLGRNETGSSAAAPIFVDFMTNALANEPAKPFPIPQGIQFKKIDRTTGRSPSPNTPQKDIIFEALKSENIDKILKDEEPTETNDLIDYNSQIY